MKTSIDYRATSTGVPKTFSEAYMAYRQIDGLWQQELYSLDAVIGEAQKGDLKGQYDFFRWYFMLDEVSDSTEPTTRTLAEVEKMESRLHRIVVYRHQRSFMKELALIGENSLDLEVHSDIENQMSETEEVLGLKNLYIESEFHFASIMAFWRYCCWVQGHESKEMKPEYPEVYLP